MPARRAYDTGSGVVLAVVLVLLLLPGLCNALVYIACLFRSSRKKS